MRTERFEIALNVSVEKSVTYSHEQVLIKILASRILLVLLLNSASFIQVDALNELNRVSHFSANKSSQPQQAALSL